MKARIKGEEFTYRQLIKMGRLPKEGIDGEERWTNGYYKVSAIYWKLEDTYVAPEEEIKAIPRILILGTFFHFEREIA